MKKFLVFVSALLLVSCSTFRDADQSISTATTEVDKVTRQAQPSQNKRIEVINDYWVSTKELPERAVDRLPATFKASETVRAEGVPFAWLMNSIANRHTIPVVYSSSIQRNLTVSVDYRGDLYGVLNAIANSTSYRWEFRDGHIYWDDLDSRTWSLPMTPGASSYLSRVGGSVTTSIQGVTEGSTSSTNNSGADADGSAQRTERTADEIDLWKDMAESVRPMLSNRGTVTVSQSASTITVRDFPDRLNAIDSYLKKMIFEISRQVYVQVEVIEVLLNDDASYGIDWSVVKNSLTGLGYGLTTANAGEIFPKNFTAPVLTLTANSPNEWQGSQALVKALQTQGNVSVRTQPRIITMNNQVAALQIGKEVGYLAKSETTAVADAGVTTALTPGVAKSGFMMYLLPRIMPKNEVIMQMSVSINNINNIRTVASGSSSIEIPEITTRNFQQLTRLRSGESMVLAGFRQMNGERKGAGVTRKLSWLAGADSAANNRIDTVVVITPYVLMDTAG